MEIDGLDIGVVDAFDVGGGRGFVGTLALAGGRDCPEKRVSGEAVRRVIDFVDVTAATSGLAADFAVGVEGAKELVVLVF